MKSGFLPNLLEACFIFWVGFSYLPENGLFSQFFAWFSIFVGSLSLLSVNRNNRPSNLFS